MVTPEGVQEALRESDILLLPHGFSGELSPEEYRTIFPTKIMEYLIAQRPILAHVAMGTYLHKFLLENGCALVVDKADVEVLKTAIATLRTNEGLRNELVANSVKTLSQFSGETISTHLREVVWGTPSSKAFSDRQT